MIYRFLYDDGYSIFQNAIPQESGDKRITAVIAGLGQYGVEMLKALIWYCQMDGYTVEIHAFDKDELTEEKFSALCPEIMSDQYNGICVPGEAQYEVYIHSGVDVEAKTYAEFIADLPAITYACVCLGNDSDNIKHAVNLRMLCERCGSKPVIKSIVYSTDKKEALSDITNYRGQSYGINFIGDIEESYSENVIMNNDVERLSLERHLKWGKEEEFWQYEYNYRSSMASAIHLKARIQCGIPGADKAEQDLTIEERDGIEMLEHRRWNAYMRSEGYVYSGSPDSSSRNDLAKMHHNLVVYDVLSDEEKRKDSSVGTI